MGQPIANESYLTVYPEIGFPFIASESLVDLRERALAACNTARDLQAFGLDLNTTEEDLEVARNLLESYAINPEVASKQVTPQTVATMRPASLVLVSSLLEEFGQLVVQNSVVIRNMVVNKLVLETENPDARVRLRALELLGKVSDVGLFTDKREVTVTHTSSHELRATLKQKLTRLRDMSQGEEVVEFEVVDGLVTGD
jgi:hypothetical protein